MLSADLFFSFKGRIGRSTFFLSIILLWCLYFNISFLLENVLGEAVSVLFLTTLLWAIFAVSVKRYHDIGKPGRNLLLLLIPVFGTVWVFLELCFRKGMKGYNRYGESPDSERLDYAKVGEEGHLGTINDVTQINPVKIKEVFTPTTVEEVANIIKSSKGPISIGGGRFSMGGQTSSPDSIHLDMRSMDKIIHINAIDKTIRVQAGVRWCNIQRAVDHHNLSVKIMQTYANFTVGGSLSVNSHGRYMGLGPLILSVRSVKVVLADGSITETSKQINPGLFYGIVGGYGGLGVIVEAELDLAENTCVRRMDVKLRCHEYLDYFKKNIRDNNDAVFHNADIYPPNYKRLRAVSWEKTEEPATSPYRLMPLNKSYPIHRYFYWAFSETPTGKWRREFIIDWLLYRKKKIHWRNYEAGYDVAELEPSSRKKSTYVLQEYFVPIGQFEEYLSKMTGILQRYKVNMINISVRHALPDPGSYLAWAREEVFAFVLYYKQGVKEEDKKIVGEWTRELVDAAIACKGTYYLPYQPHATVDQFHKAYPRAKEFFEMKKKLDPEFRFRNSLWNKYYEPFLNN